MHGLLFYLHHRKLSATAFTERRDSSGENTAVPGEYGIFIPLLFYTHGVLYTVFLQYVKDIIDMKDIINWHDEEM